MSLIDQMRMRNILPFNLPEPQTIERIDPSSIARITEALGVGTPQFQQQRGMSGPIGTGMLASNSRMQPGGLRPMQVFGTASSLEGADSKFIPSMAEVARGQEAIDKPRLDFQKQQLAQALGINKANNEIDMERIKAGERAATSNRESQLESNRIASAERESIAKENRTSREGIAEANRKSAEVRAGETGWKTGNITDPDDPSKQIAVRYNEKTGAVERIKLNDEGLGAISKPGTSGFVQPKNLQDIRQKTTDTLADINKILNSDGSLKDDAKMAIGKSRVFGMHNVPGTNAYKTNNVIGRLKAEKILDLIKEMKSQSKTGATGFGQMNLKELGVLENAAASMLDPNLPEEDFAATLNEVRNRLLLVMNDEASPGNAGKESNQPVKKTAEDYIKQYGGR